MRFFFLSFFCVLFLLILYLFSKSLFNILVSLSFCFFSFCFLCSYGLILFLNFHFCCCCCWVFCCISCTIWICWHHISWNRTWSMYQLIGGRNLSAQHLQTENETNNVNKTNKIDTLYCNRQYENTKNKMKTTNSNSDGMWNAHHKVQSHWWQSKISSLPKRLTN